MCNNIIYITYLDKDVNSLPTNLYYVLVDNYKILEFDDLNDKSLITEIKFLSDYVAPLSHLQELCNKYNIDIIGVSYDFENGYVESFELKNELIEEEDKTPHIIQLVNINDVEAIIEQLPLNQDEDIFEKEYPLEDELNLNDLNIIQ